MPSHARFSHGRPDQQGAVLFVAMVVLVALALAALALLRSTDIAGLIASNLAFKRSALNSTDLGFMYAKRAVDQLNSGVLRNATTAGSCYSATQLSTDTRGVPTALVTASAFDTAYPSCHSSGLDSTETVRYIVDRLCASASGTFPTQGTCVAVELQQTGINSGQQLPTMNAAYRVTVRVDGPRNTTSFSQMIAR